MVRDLMKLVDKFLGSKEIKLGVFIKKAKLTEKEGRLFQELVVLKATQKAMEK